jgi:hypothetical protein
MKSRWEIKKGVEAGRDQLSGARARFLANQRQHGGLGEVRYTAWTPDGECVGEFPDEERAHAALVIKQFEKNNPDHVLQKIDDYNYKLVRRSELPAAPVEEAST